MAFSVDGVTTGFGVFAHTDSVQRVASLLAAMDGVGVVTARDESGRILVRADSAVAEINIRGSGVAMNYRYQPQRGDPLRYRDVLVRMQHDHAVDADGYADAATWLRYTAAEFYPAAPPRIVAGHSRITLNPAPILVSLDDKARVGLGAVSIANRMRPLGGTHGALSATNSLGVLMTNFVDTHDDLSTSVRHQFGGFDDLHDPATHQSTLRLATSAMLRADRWSSFGGQAHEQLAALPDSNAVLVLSLSDADRQWKGADARVLVDVRKNDRGADGGSRVSNSYWALSQWIPALDARAFAMSVPQLGLSALAPSTAYLLRVVLYRNSGSAQRGAASKLVASLNFRTDAHGVVAIY